MLASIGEMWLGSAIRPRAAITVVTPRSRGTSAATRAPNAITRIRRVSGSESNSACARSDANVSFSSLFELTLPNCSTRRSGWSAATALIVSFSRLESVPRLEVIPGDVELHQRGVLINGHRCVSGQRRHDVPHVLRLRQLPRGLLDRRVELGIPDLELVALDQHVLGVRPQAGVVERLLGPAGLAGELVRTMDLVLPDGVAEQHGDHNEGKPPEDGGLAVLGAPVCGACGEVVGLLHDVSPVAVTAVASSVRPRIPLVIGGNP